MALARLHKITCNPFLERLKSDQVSTTEQNAADIVGLKTQLTYIETMVREVSGKLDRWQEVYATKQELRETTDELRQELYKDLSYRRRAMNEKITNHQKTVEDLAEVVEPLRNYADTRRRGQMIHYGIIALLVFVAGLIDPELIELIQKYIP
jgi:predicted RNase H-like nuclease (RuvC/YqgF family)